MLRSEIQWSYPPPAKTKTLLDAVLAARGVKLSDLDQTPPDPFLLPDMKKACNLILQTVLEGGKICVFGDYDVDGMTAGAGLTTGLRRLGANAELFIPTRQDGFGLSETSIRKMVDLGANLIITVDNGSDRHAEVELAHELGVKVIITDHHLISPKHMAKAEAVVNPVRTDSKYPFKKLCGSGIAYFTLEALSQQVATNPPEGMAKRKVDMSDLIGLAALGTMADVVDIIGPNRYIVSEGLKRLEKLPGIKALLEVNNLTSYTARDITFLVIPMLNAPGRLSTPKPSVDILLCTDPKEADMLARTLQMANTTRKSLGNEMKSIAQQHIDNPQRFPETYTSIFFWSQKGAKYKGLSNEEETDSALELSEFSEGTYRSSSHSGWLHGLVGILAGQIAETYNRPTFVGTEEPGVDLIKGSARCNTFMVDGTPVSIKEIMDKAEELYEADLKDGVLKERFGVAAPEEPTLFVSYGGHPGAGGFSVKPELVRLGILREYIEKASRPLMEQTDKHRVKIADVNWTLPTRDELASLSALEPTGHGFELPLIYVPDVTISEIRRFNVPGQKFMSRTIILRQGDKTMNAVCFRKGEKFTVGDRLDLLISPHNEGVQIHELRPHNITIDDPEVQGDNLDLDLDLLLLG